MIIGLLLKYWRNLLDAIIVIVVIVGVFIWNPFGLFGSGLKLNQSANLLTNVKAIGQLVTAEYYGEVIASLDESELNLLEKDELSVRAEELYQWLKYKSLLHLDELVFNVYDESELAKNKRKVRRSTGKVVDEMIRMYHNDIPSRSNLVDRDNLEIGNASKTDASSIRKTRLDTADIVLMYLAQEMFGDRIKLKKYIEVDKRKKLRENQLENLVLHIKKQYMTLPEQEFKAFLDNGFPSNIPFSAFYIEYKTAEFRKTKGRKYEKKKLAMIGRGSVKAGFDFGELDDHKLKYDEANATIHLFGVDAQILGSEINPWFIPERKVPGFDIVAYNGQVTFEDAQVVKGYCRRKLETYAREAEIIDQAREFGEEGLKAFFSLLTGQEIMHVKFHADQLGFHYKQLAADSVITQDEIGAIEEIVNAYLAVEESDKTVKDQRALMLNQFMTNLKQMKLKVNDSILSPFNFYTRMLPGILQDSMIDQFELKQIREMRPKVVRRGEFSIPLKSEYHRSWFVDSLDVIKDYNRTITFLDGSLNIPFFEVNVVRDSLSTVDDTARIMEAISSRLIGVEDTIPTDTRALLNYSINADVITKTEVIQRIAPKYKMLYFHINLDKELAEECIKYNRWPHDISGILKGELDENATFKLNDSFYLTKKRVKSTRQKQENLAYQFLLKKQHDEYQEMGAIIHASDWVKNKLLKDTFQGLKSSITSWSIQ